MKIPARSKTTIETLKLAAPIAAAQLGHILFGVADNIMVGSLGAIDLAAASLVNNIATIPMVFIMGFSAGNSAFISRSFGARKHSEVGKWLVAGLGVNVILLFLVTAALGSVYFFLDKLGQPPEVVEKSRVYYLLIMGSMLPFVLYGPLKQFCEGISKPKAPLIITYVAVGINIFLNWMLIHGNLGMPALGLIGSGVATLIAKIAMLILLFLVLNFGYSYKIFEIKWLKPHDFWMRLKSITRYGVPSGMQYLFEVGAFAGSGLMMGWFGAREMAGHQIALNLASVSFMVALGISIASSVRVGQAIGANELKHAREIGFDGFKLSAFFMAASGFVFAFYGRQIASLYIADPIVLEWASKFLVVVAIFQVFDGLQAVGVGVLRAYQDVRIPTIITFVAYWIIAFPISYFLGPADTSNSLLGPVGIWIGLAFGLGFAALCLLVRYHLKTKVLVG